MEVGEPLLKGLWLVVPSWAAMLVLVLIWLPLELVGRGLSEGGALQPAWQCCAERNLHGLLPHSSPNQTFLHWSSGV